MEVPHHWIKGLEEWAGRSEARRARAFTLVATFVRRGVDATTPADTGQSLGRPPS